MSRKERSFGQLVSYIERDHQDGLVDFYYNFHEQNRGAVIAQFQDNSRLLPQRKNGNVMYHEVVSIVRHPDVTEAHQKQALKDVVEKYVQERAPGCLVFGTLHDDQDHSFHYHLIISANELGDSKRHSLKKASYNRVKQDAERYCNETYPELEQGWVIGKDPKHRNRRRETDRNHAGIRVSERGQQLRRRTGRMPRREALTARVTSVLSSSDYQATTAQLAANELEFYQHGNQIGVIDLKSGRKHRLKTLGLLDDFNRFQASMALADQQSDAACSIDQAREPDRPAADREPFVGLVEADEPISLHEARFDESVADLDPASDGAVHQQPSSIELQTPIHRHDPSRTSHVTAPEHSRVLPEDATQDEAPDAPNRIRRDARQRSSELSRRTNWVNDWRRQRDPEHEDER